MTFTEIIYGWLIISTLSIAGPTWYAFPRTRLDLRAVDELEILLGCTERCLATQTNAIGYQAPPMRHIMQIRNTNGAMQTVTNALTWQLASKAMLTGNDAALKAAIPFYVQTNTATHLSPGISNWTFGSLMTSLAVAFGNWPYTPIAFTDYEDRYKVENAMEWTQRDAATTNMEYWRGYAEIETNASTPLTNGGALAYAAAVEDYVFITSGVFSATLRQECLKKQWVKTTCIGTNCYQTNLIVTTERNYLSIITNLVVVSQGNTSDWIDVISTGNKGFGGWVEMPGLPAGRVYSSVSVLANNIYLIGGHQNDGTTNVFKFDGNSWTEVQGLPSSRYHFGAAMLNGKIYSVGGTGPSGKPTTNVFEFDGSSWTEVAGLPSARDRHAVAALGNKIYSISGYNGDNDTTNVFEFDGTSWVEVTGFPVATENLIAGTLDGKIYVIGVGTTVYSFNGSVWDTVEPRPVNWTFPGVSVMGDNLYSVGGNDRGEGKTNVYRFNGTNWMEIDGLPVGNFGLSAAAIGTNLYAIGGYAGRTNVYRYNAPLGTFIEASGIYKPSESNQWFCDTNSLYLFKTNGGYAISTNTVIVTNEPYLIKSGEPIGVWTAVNFVSDSTISSWVTVPDWSGSYYDKTNYWQHSSTDSYVAVGGDGWFIYSNLNLNTSEFYFTKNGTVTGDYNAVNFYTTNTYARYESVTNYNPVDPTGIYTPASYQSEGRDVWTNGDWTILYSNSWYYITTNTAELSPAWKLESETPAGTYSDIVGTGITGTATVVGLRLYEPIYETNIVYACELRKYGADYYAYTGTAMSHRVQGFYVYPQPGNHAKQNIYHDHGLSLSNSVWNLIANTVDFTKSTENSVHIGGDLSVAPDEGPDASDWVPSVSYGFRLGIAPKFIFDWDFIYATNRYW